MVLERVWTRANTPSDRILWDSGDEQWELRGGVVRHYRVLGREWIQPGVSLRETVELLPETPVPTEVFSREEFASWDYVVRKEGGSSLPLPPASSLPKGKGGQGQGQKPQGGPQGQVQKPQGVQKKKQKPVAAAADESESHDDPTPSPLDCWDWSSLSQWIPPSALFQASLHHQALAELDTPRVQRSPVTPFAHPKPAQRARV